MAIQVVILAAGQGKRMFSRLPKVLHHLAGKPLLEHVIETALTISKMINSVSTKPIVVFGHQGEQIQEKLNHHDVEWVKQEYQLGTGHALLQALPQIAETSKVLVLCGDVPLISVDTLKKLIEATSDNNVGMLTVHSDHPHGYGRIVRNEKNKVIKIIEEKDANDQERTIKEINPGVYYLSAKNLKQWLPLLNNKNAQQEYYLTEIFDFATKENISITTTQPFMNEEVLGVNDRVQLANLERHYQRQMAEKFMRSGVTLLDPSRFDVRGKAQIGRDVVIDANVILQGEVYIGDNCEIGANCIISNSNLSDEVVVKPNSIIDGATIAKACVIGPYARIRPETILAQKSHIGNFVEIKKSVIGEESKINHLSYIGDSEVGKRVNIGAGTITCNYDGVFKNKTIIENEAFIGSGTQLVAPVTIGVKATIGAGSTITEDAPPEKLTLSRGRQQTIEGWKRKEKSQ